MKSLGLLFIFNLSLDFLNLGLDLGLDGFSLGLLGLGCALVVDRLLQLLDLG